MLVKNKFNMKNELLSNFLNQFEEEKICHLLECNIEELNSLFDKASNVYTKNSGIYDTLLKILQQGNNIREAALISLICGRLIGFGEAEDKIEEEIKEKLFNAFKNNRPLR
tara:strand:- start:451 stop:783 length:333 start_codon:yes stop_codon:yes gene_type:complete